MFKNFITILFLAAATGVFMVPVKNSWEEIVYLQSQKKDFNEALTNSREAQNLRDELLNQYNSISRENFGRLNQILPSKIETMNLVVEMANRVEARGMLLKSITVEPIGENDPSSILADRGGEEKPIMRSISFSVSGSYSSLRALLNDLVGSLRLIEIERLSFSSNASEIYEFKINAKTYWLP